MGQVCCVKRSTVLSGHHPLDGNNSGDGSSGPNDLIRNYGVFLNHRGPDVKKHFVDHLHASLKIAGVQSFVDYEELRVGEDAWNAIVSAIHHSRVHLAVFSPGYADSFWCLNELCEMLECYDEGSSDHFVPVFYNVTPTDLRSATSEHSCYFSAFVKLHRHHGRAVVEKWRKALHKASIFSGWTLNVTSGFEARLVKLIVTDVLNVLNRTLLDGARHPVGVNEKLQEALHLMQIDALGKGVNKLGIFGMGGVGKTTLAKAIYNGIYREFENVSFMHNVREEAKGFTGLRGLQERMLRALLKTDAISVDSTAHGKQLMKERLQGLKVMIILDDVDDREQLEELLPPDGCHLRDGSQIVITTRDEQIVIWAGAQKRLAMEGLSPPHAHLLFRWHAFLGQDEPSEDFRQLANTVVEACQGLPLALEVLGSHLYSKDVVFWAETVKVLEGQRRTLVPAQQQVTSVLKISYDGLGSDEEKLMFLDIACFLLGEHEDRAKRIWRELDAVELCLENLRLKCLVKVDQNRRLTMHDHLRDMGREIVKKKQPNIWQRSHLWNEKDARSVLRSELGTCDVRGLGLIPKDQVEFGTRSFAGMSALQLLVLSNAILTGDFNLMPKELRWFQWRYCLLESLPLELGLENVAVLDLMGSKITSFSCGLMLENLTELNLRECVNLKELPEVSSCFERLEMLDLEGCVNLEKIPDSVWCLSSSLRYLNISNCTKLRTLPDGIVDLRSLNTLLMNHCTGLTKLPDAIGQLTTLREIGLEGVALSRFPQSFGDMGNLISLQLNGCSQLSELPSTIGNLRKLSSLVINSCPCIYEIPPGASSLTNLVHFQISYCKSIHRLAVNVEKLQKLETFHVYWNNNLSSIPPTISQLEKLTSLQLGDCNIQDGGLPTEYSALSSLKTVFLQYNSITRLPRDFGRLPNLQTLQLHHCQHLWEVSFLPITLTFLDIGDCRRLERIPCLSSLKELRGLVLCNCTGLIELTGLQCLGCLSELNISGCRRLERLPGGLENLTMLKSLYLAGSGVSLLQDTGPWVQRLVSLELVSLHRSYIPDCMLSCKKEIEIIQQEYANTCCMEVGVQGGDIACKGVLCCFVSHDQGWSDHPWDHGRYSSSYTTMKVEVVEGENSSPVYIQMLFVNRHADIRNQLHISIFRASHPLVASLRGGGTIRMIAESRFKGWAITVREGAVKLMYEENEMQETLVELSRQVENLEDVLVGDNGQFHLWTQPEDPISAELRDWNVNHGGLPIDYPTLSSLQEIRLQNNNMPQLPTTFHLLTSLQRLALNRFDNLSLIPCLPPTLTDLDMGDCVSLQAILCLSSLTELKKLVLCNCTNLTELSGLDSLSGLVELNITGCRSLINLPSGLEKLTSMKFLYLAGSGVSLLQDNVPWIQNLISLELVSIYGSEVPDCFLSKVQIQGVAEKQHANEHCLEVVVPDVDVAWKAVLFCFVSHDQGWSSYPWDHGRYQNSHTSMQADILERGGRSTRFSQNLFVNRHADRNNQLHISIFRAPHPFVASLRSGDIICVLAKSAFPGWAITVREGAVKLFSRDNGVEDTLRELSRQQV